MRPLEIETGTFSDPAEIKAMMRGIQMCRELGNSVVMSAFVKREVVPGDLAGSALDDLLQGSLKSHDVQWLL
jgi:choline dehydrogenase